MYEFKLGIVVGNGSPPGVCIWVIVIFRFTFCPFLIFHYHIRITQHENLSFDTLI